MINADIAAKNRLFEDGVSLGKKVVNPIKSVPFLL